MELDCGSEGLQFLFDVYRQSVPKEDYSREAGCGFNFPFSWAHFPKTPRPKNPSAAEHQIAAAERLPPLLDQ